MANSSDQDLRKKRLKPKKAGDGDSRSSRPAQPASAKPRASRPTKASPSGSNRSKPVSRVRLKALRTSTPTASSSEHATPPPVTAAAPSPRPSQSSRKPLERETTQPQMDSHFSHESDDDHDATIMNLSSDFVEQARSRSATDELVLGDAQIPEYSEEVETHDKTVVGFAIGDGFADLAGNKFDEPVIATSGINTDNEPREESYNDEKTMFGVAMNLESRTVTPAPPSPPKLPPSPPQLKRKATAIPPSSTEQNVVSQAIEAASPPALPKTPTKKREPSGGLQTIPRSSVVPISDTSPQSDMPIPDAPLKSSASSIRGATVNRASLVDLDPVMPASGADISPPQSISTLEMTANSNAGRPASARSTPIFAAKHPRPTRRSDYGWGKNILLNLIPGSSQIALGKSVEGARELAVAVLVLIPAIYILASWNIQIARVSALSISEAWMIAHGAVCAGSLLMFEMVRVSSSNYSEELEFIIPRWVSAFFLPSLFLLYMTPRLVDVAPSALELVWFAALLVGGISCITSSWCVIYGVRRAGLKSIKFWGAICIGVFLFGLLLLSSGVINPRTIA